MIIVGAGGLAAQIFDDLVTLNIRDLVFWSETETKYPFIKEKYPILQNDGEITNYFNTVNRKFVVGIWNIEHRKKLTEKFKNLGGEVSSFISPFNYLSPYTTIGEGSLVLHKASTEPGVIIGEHCILNKRSNYGHGCRISSFCSIGPFAIVASDSVIGESSFIGMGAIIQPKVKIGKNVIIAAGSVVSRNIPDNAVVSGVPGDIRYYRKNNNVFNATPMMENDQ